MRAYERFLQYVQVDTQSDPFSDTTPSTEKQKDLGRLLVEEMTRMGLEHVRMSDTGYVYGELPANVEGKPTLGLIAHMDTTPDLTGTHVTPRVVEGYDGGIIPLGDSGEVLDPAKFPHLLQYVGQDLIVTDGTTLLGADDKAGVAEILTAAETILAENRPHGRIVVGFTPDEEIGRGADLFDVPAFGADFAYTVDGGQIGELEYENFNGAAALVTIHGVNIHPGEAKDKMKNACLIAMEFHRMVPPAQAPAHTCGYEGFYHLAHMEGSEELACLRYIIRDHDKDKFRQKKEQFERIARYLNETYGEGTVELELTDSYYNMKEKILPHMHLIENAKAAMEACGVTPQVIPIRGGTDGANLSYKGLPCPNLSTGGHNAHSRHEYIPIQSMDKAVQVLLEIVRLYSL